MNLLAHALLAHATMPDHQGQQLTGSLMADYFGGQRLVDYPPAMVSGILQHRMVDAFTDNHPEFIAIRRRLSANGAPRFAAGILVDLFWDYILGSRWQRFGEPLCRLKLPAFCQVVHRALQQTEPWRSPQFARVAPWLINDEWLAAYATSQGIAAALAGLASRLPHGAPLAGCERLLIEHEDALELGFTVFWPDLVEAARAYAPGTDTPV